MPAGVTWYPHNEAKFKVAQSTFTPPHCFERFSLLTLGARVCGKPNRGCTLRQGCARVSKSCCARRRVDALSVDPREGRAASQGRGTWVLKHDISKHASSPSRVQRKNTVPNQLRFRPSGVDSMIYTRVTVVSADCADFYHVCKYAPTRYTPLWSTFPLPLTPNLGQKPESS